MITIKELIDQSLDRAFKRNAGAMLTQVNSISTGQNSAMQNALRKLDVEAAELDKMKVDNAQLQQTINAYRDTTNTTARMIRTNDNAIVEGGQTLAEPSVLSRMFPGLSNKIIAAGKNPLTQTAATKKLLASSGVNWHTLNAAEFADKYTSSAAWIKKLDTWGDGYADLTEKVLLQGIQNGWSPQRIASVMRQHAENVPRHAAESLARTLQITSYREAALQMEDINGDYIIKKVRIAKLDGNTCLTCISLHGTPLKRGERVDDHIRGRCTEYYVLPGGSEFPSAMQADSTPGNRNFVPWQTGEDWFASLSESRQQQQVSFLNTPAKWRAYQAGTPLSAFIKTRMDDVFGRQVIETSLIKAIGDEAEQYYKVNQ